MARTVNSPGLRPAVMADVADLARVQRNSALTAFAHIFPEYIPKPTQQGLEVEWRAALADERQDVLLAEVAGVVAGIVAFGRQEFLRAGSGCALRKLYVDPEFAGNGVGSLLHDRAIVELRETDCIRVHLWVLERNIPARRMYVNRGWRLQPSTRSDWPGSGILELCYTLELATRL